MRQSLIYLNITKLQVNALDVTNMHRTSICIIGYTLGIETESNAEGMTLYDLKVNIANHAWKILSNIMAITELVKLEKTDRKAGSLPSQRHGGES